MLGLHHATGKGWHPVAEAIGWVGAVAVLLAYALATFNLIPADGWLYPTLNLIGAVGILVIVTVKKVVQSIILNAVWALVALVALAKLFLG